MSQSSDVCPASPGPAHSALSAACRSSLERSRTRRAIADRLRVRRRRSRSSGASLAMVAATFAVGAPLALATGGATSGLVSAGSHGSRVAAIQRALGIPVTGSFDVGTQRAVRSFQRAHGLAVDGIVGPITRAALGLSGGAAAASAPSAPNAQLASIAACESGGSPTAVSADGRYRGKYQFTRATWRAVGGQGDPAQAPESEQDQRAATLLAQRGTSPWPNCA
jgi:hypothetical protein